ncbi:unnamed protein product [Arctia plantaginis]|uniref:Uncharacterized protein n=1 Tax=Arctia plantaginis TaxID=874455 RepID=A0A8S0ZGZ9_ARCPL|nr:unnamed protein product [Arctia plantaginis]
MSKSRHIAHNKQAPAAKLNQRIAEEAQLLAEEKWIIGALKKIKAQKNGLQIERLHLESMRAKLLEVLNPEQTIEISVPASTAINTDEEIQETAAKIPNVQEVNTCFMVSEDASQQNLNNDELCNTEELNLSVTNSIFRSEPYGAACDEEEEEEDMENCILDMDMLMSGK